MIARNVHVVTAPDPLALLTMSEARDHLRLDGVELDPQIADLIRTAYATVETQTNRCLLNATLQTTFDRFPVCRGDRPGLELPRSPLVSVSSVTYTDPDGTQQTLSADAYAVRTRALPGRVDIRQGYDWPETLDEPASVVVEYVAGYGSTAAAVPPQAKHAMRMLVSHWFDHSGPTSMVSVAQVPHTVDMLLAQIAAPEVV